MVAACAFLVGLLAAGALVAGWSWPDMRGGCDVATATKARTVHGMTARGHGYTAVYDHRGVLVEIVPDRPLEERSIE